MTIKDQNNTGKKPKTMFYRGLGRTLLSAFLALAIIPMTVVSIISYRNAHQSLQDDAGKALHSVANLKTQQIDDYFDEILTDLMLQSEMHSNMQFLASLENLADAYKESGLPVRDFTRSFKWTLLVEEKGNDLKAYRRTYGYHDIFLMDAQGNILFTAAGEEDLGTNLFQGKNAGTRFAAACQKALTTGRPAFSDYEVYDPSGVDAVFGFFAAAIVEDDGEKIGLIALQFAIDPIDKIMQAPIGLGKTAETYLVGPDLKMRSNSILSAAKTVLKNPVETAQTRLWKQQIDKNIAIQAMEHTESIYNGPHGQAVLGTHSDIDIEGVSFAVVAEIEQKEAFASADRLRSIMFGLLMVTGLLVVLIAVFISRRIVRPIQTLSAGAQRVAAGDLGHTIEVRSKNEIGEMTNSFNAMVQSLRQTSAENTLQSWYKTGLAQLNEDMRGDKDMDELGRSTITFLAKYLDAKIGAIYLADDHNDLKLVGSYAYKKRKNLSSTFRIGEGLVGQAALEKESILLANVPDDYIAISSGLGETVPRNILVLPFMHNGDVKGVVELGSLREFSDTDLNFLNQVSESIAIAIHSAESRHKVRKLLEQTQIQAKELETQQEELRASNEELEEQREELRSTNEELESQTEELRASNEELEEKTEVLESQKQEIEKRRQQVEQAKQGVEEKARELERASKYKSEFLANMSHELRTPLNSLLILAKILKDNDEGNLTAEQVESADVIYGGGQQLLMLINDILDLSKVEAGKMEIHNENVSFDALAGSITTQFGPLAKEKNLNLEVVIGPDAPSSFMTDGQRLGQILRNLLSNAFKFTAAGSVTLEIGLPDEQTQFSDKSLTTGNTLAFAVKDTGPGIAKDKMQSIFEAFQQADGSTNRRYGGTGLGLSISRAMSDLLGGEIQLHSEEGRGSTFTLLLPLERRREKTEEQAEPKDAPEHPKRRTIQHAKPQVVPSHGTQFIPDDRADIKEGDKTVLIIEDDARFSKVLMNQSRKKGFKCLAAGDGGGGLQLAAEYKPSAIILDLGLPDIDGSIVLDNLKYSLSTRHIPVHVISAQDKNNELLTKGAIGFLTKPVTTTDIDEVFVRIENILNADVRRVLVVEDDTDNRKAILALLESKHVEIKEAATGTEAIQLIKESVFDCVILDLGLPDMTGFDLLDQLDKDDAVQLPPIVVFTGKALTSEELLQLSRYTTKIVVKDANSPERLLDETSLFLHSVESNLPREHRKTLRMFHDPDSLLKDKKVLLVDDDLRNNFAMSRALTRQGIEVVMADNGQMALDKMKENGDIDLVLMDIMMPVMDGYEAMKQIRKQRQYKNLPIIALTAKALVEDRAKCIKAGANDYLAKPVDMDRLESLMQVLLCK